MTAEFPWFFKSTQRQESKWAGGWRCASPPSPSRTRPTGNRSPRTRSGATSACGIGRPGAKREVRRHFEADAEVVSRALITPDGRVAYFHSENATTLYDPQSGRELFRTDGYEVYGTQIFLCPNGRYFLSVYDDVYYLKA